MVIQSQKNLFWEAFVIAIFIFGTGILIGIIIENSRTDIVSELYATSEMNLLDVQIQTQIFDTGDLNCQEAEKKTIEFADKIYRDAQILDRYEGASRLDNSLVQYHKRYDLLRTLLWLNTIKLQEKCNTSFHTIVYLYNYQPEDLEEKNKQGVFSNYLEELKIANGDKLILIPIARNLNISSLDLLTRNFGITQTSIIVDERQVITDFSGLELIKEYIKR